MRSATLEPASARGDPAAPGMPAPLIEAVDLERRFGAVRAVAGVSLRVAPGEVLALLGPNGAGKTTTMQVLAALLPPTAGSATVAGYDVVRAATAVRARVGLMIDEPGFYPEMLVSEYLLFVARLYGLPVREARVRIAAMLGRFRLDEKGRARLSTLSKGMRQKVALIRALLHAPPVLLLDEPTSALDPLSARDVHEFIRERRAAGCAIIISTHNLPEAEALADRVAIIAAGRLCRQGTRAELCRPVAGQERFVLTALGTLPAGVVAGLAAVPDLHDLATAEAVPGRVELTYRTSEPDAVNAALITALAGTGMAVVELRPDRRQLSEVYLEAIAEAAV